MVGKNRYPSLTDQELLPYTNAVLHESLRVTSLAFQSVPHCALEDIPIPGKEGWVIPKGAIVFTVIERIMNDPEYFDKPEIFNPDRFIDPKTGKYVRNERVVPFGIGKRVCLGQSLAEKEFFLFFTGIMQQFELKAASEELPTYKESYPEGITRAAPPYKVMFKPRLT